MSGRWGSESRYHNKKLSLQFHWAVLLHSYPVEVINWGGGKWSEWYDLILFYRQLHLIKIPHHF